jgi:KDO2-lipid IV(A) lauroyltransferase
VLEVLRAGGVVGLVADLEARRLSGTFAPFFGRPTLTMTAPAALARVHAVPLVPVRCVADGPGEPYVLAVDEPLEPAPGLARRDATLELTARLNALFERWIRAAPEQWAWHQPRWRIRPEDPHPAARNAARWTSEAPLRVRS